MQIERACSKFSKNKRWPLSGPSTRNLQKLGVKVSKYFQEKNQVFSSENNNTRSWITLKQCFQNSEGKWSVFRNTKPRKKQQSNVSRYLKYSRTVSQTVFLNVRAADRAGPTGHCSSLRVTIHTDLGVSGSEEEKLLIFYIKFILFTFILCDEVTGERSQQNKALIHERKKPGI